MFSKRNPRGSGGGHLDKKINALFRKLDKMKGTAKEGSTQYIKILRDLQVLTRERVSSPLPNPLLQTILLGNPSGNPTSPGCPTGKVRSRRGKCVKPIGYKPKKGMLYGWTKRGSAATRRRALRRSITADGWTTTIRRLNWLVNQSGDQKTRMVARQDAQWMRDERKSLERPAELRKVANPLAKAYRPRKNPAPPSVEVPFREGQKIPVAEARAWVESTGDQELIRQFREAEAIQKKANRAPKTVVWRTIPIGSPTELDMVTAMAHYGKSPETLYRAPKGSKKGQHMYRHEWGDGSGREKPVDVLAPAGGGAIVMPLNEGQMIGDWMRG